MQLDKHKGNRAAIARLLGIMFVAIMVVGFLTFLVGPNAHKNDLQLYYKASLMLMQGQVPYRDFAFEYPPLALLPMVLPQLVTFGYPLSFNGYVGLFLLESALLSILIGLIILQVVSRLHSSTSSIRVLRVYVLLAIISAPLLPWRYDLFPALLTLLTLLAVLVNRPTLAGICLGCSIAAKLYPVVLIPIFSVYYLVSRKYQALLRLLLASISVTCLALLPFMLLAPKEVFSFMRYHQLRGLQIESIPSGVILLGHMLGLTQVSHVFNYGARHLVSPIADDVLKWLPFVSILASVVVIAICLSCFRRERGSNRTITAESLIVFVTAVLLTFMVTAKVFSPQYIVWLLPFAPLLRPRQVRMLIAIFAMTIIIFPFAYRFVVWMHPVGILLLNIRNILAVVLLLGLLVEHLPPSIQIPFIPQRRPV